MTNTITNKQLATYLNDVFNHKYFKRAICFRGENNASKVYMELGNILTKYYISTLDDSKLSVKIILDNYMHYMEQGKTIEEFYNNYLIKLMQIVISSKIGVNPNTLSGKVKIAEFIADQNKTNQFYTHCFPGALYEEININGFDISKEMFAEEFQTLSKSFRSTYKTGKLCYCEFSEASLSYATEGVPERVKFCIGGFGRKRNPNENRHDYYIRCLKENLDEELTKGHITQVEYQKMFIAGKKILDFYCKNDDTCIAIWKGKESTNKTDYTSIIIERFKMMFKANTIIKDSYINESLNQILNHASKNPEKAINIIEEGIKRLSALNPTIKKCFDAYLDDLTQYLITNLAIKNLKYGGNADGYEIPGGKINRNEYEIIRFELPMETARNNKFAYIELDDEIKIQPSYKTYIDEIMMIDKILRSIQNNEIPNRIIVIQSPDKKQIPIVIYSNRILTLNSEIVNVENGIITITALGRKYIERQAIARIKDQLRYFSKEKKKQIISEFKASSEYSDLLYEGSEKEYLYDDALTYYVRKIYLNMDEKERKELDSSIINEHNQILIDTKDGSYTMVEPNGNRIIAPYEILMDMSKPEDLYYFMSVKTGHASSKDIFPYSVVFNKDLEQIKKI